MPIDFAAVRKMLTDGQPKPNPRRGPRLGKQYPTVITARMPQSLHAALKELAAEQRQSLNEWVVETLWNEAKRQLDDLDAVND